MAYISCTYILDVYTRSLIDSTPFLRFHQHKRLATSASTLFSSPIAPFHAFFPLYSGRCIRDNFIAFLFLICFVSFNRIRGRIVRRMKVEILVTGKCLNGGVSLWKKVPLEKFGSTRVANEERSYENYALKSSRKIIAIYQ